MPKVAINLVTWNGEKYIDDCLDSIIKQTFSDYLLLLVDNGSVDKTLQHIEEKYLPLLQGKIRLVKNKSNLGFARAHNQAILWTDSEYVMVLNQDVILEPDYLAKVAEFMDTHKNCASVTGKILRWDFTNSEELKSSTKSDQIDSLGLKIFKNQRVIEIASGEKDEGQYQEVQEIFGVSGTCSVYRRKALADIRYGDEFFDNDFFSYKEDVDLAYRLRWRSWSSFYLPQAVAYHDRTAKSQEKLTDFGVIKLRRYKAQYINYHSYKNHLFLLKKNLSPKLFFSCFFQILFYELKKFIYVLILEPASLKAWAEYCRQKKVFKRKRSFVMKNRLIKDEDMRRWFN